MDKNINNVFLDLKAVHDDLQMISTDIIVIADWVPLKCRYGCSNYGKHLSCPPFSPTPEEMRRVLSEYRHAALARFEARPDQKLSVKAARQALGNTIIKIQRAIFDLERAAFLAGCYKAFGLNAMPCALCDSCIIEEMEKKDLPIYDLDRLRCKNKEIMRPSMEACGIDVFKTLQNAGHDPRVLKGCTEKIELFGLILLD